MRAYWRGLFPGEIPEVPVLPELFDGDSIDLDGHKLRVIDIGQGDIEHLTIVHVPSLRAVAAGDVVYNQVHMLTALTDATAREAWIASIDSIAALDPDIVVAGHKRVGAPDSRDTIEQSERYLRDFSRIAAESDTAEQIVAAMLELHGDRDNPVHAVGLRASRRTTRLGDLGRFSAQTGGARVCDHGLASESPDVDAGAMAHACRVKSPANKSNHWT
jgi:glyoxylase-like metal-dependent hydrolase (beta-lactamase superfamily II)